MSDGTLTSYSELTINSCFYGRLNWSFEYLPLSPHLNHTTELLLYLSRSCLVGGGGSFSDDRRKCKEEIILPPSFGLLSDFIGKVDQIESFPSTAILEPLQPQGTSTIRMPPVELYVRKYVCKGCRS